MNLAKDHLRRQRMSAGKEAAIITHHEQTIATPAIAWQTAHEIRDDALRLMFVCCHPAVAPDAQVVLALKMICGFSTAEIARAFLSSDAAIEKQLTRTKQRIHEAGIAFEIPEGEDLAPRLNGVLAALYLLFNEGYKASSRRPPVARGAEQRGHPPDGGAPRPPGRPHPARARAARPHAVDGGAFPLPPRRARRPAPAPRPGPLEVGPQPDRTGPAAPRRRRRGRRPERIPPAGRHRRHSLHGGGLRRHRLGAHPAPLRRALPAQVLAGRGVEPRRGRRPPARSAGGARRPSPRSPTATAWSRITCCTPSQANCTGG